MKRTFKKILCTLLVVVMCLTAAPLQGFVDFDWSWLDFSMRANAVDEYTEGYYRYIVENGEVTITDVDNNISGDVIVPSTLGGYKVTTIGESAFDECDNLTSITISDSVTTIGYFAFYSCINLKEVALGNSVNRIGESCFYDCRNLAKINIPDSVVTIDDGAFSDCIALKEIIIGSGVVNIGELAFSNCFFLEKCILGNRVETIGDSAFEWCENLTSITIPESVTDIGDSVFTNCGSLSYIQVDENNAYYSDDEGVLFNKNKTELIRYPSGNSSASYDIPIGVILISHDSFWECDKVKIITIPDSVITIEEHVFDGCSNLVDINIPDSVKSIGESAFCRCTSITNMTIPESITTLNTGLFQNCTSLTHISIPNGITTIGNSAFANCTSIENINLPNSVTSIDVAAFARCENLLSIKVPDSVNFIGFGAFFGCDNLVSVTIPYGITSIFTYTFYQCYNLTSIVIPDSVVEIHSDSFYCENLKNVYYSGTEEQWKKISIDGGNESLTNATIHYNYKPAPTTYFMVSSDQYSVDSIHHKETATYKVHLLDENSDFLSVDEVIVQNNTTDIVNISTNKVSDTELELTVEPLKDGDASISLFNGDGSVEQFFNFTVYSNTTTYRADQVPVTNEKLKTNFSRGDMTVDNFEYYFDENKGKYIATMDVYNRSSSIGVVAAYTQDGKISEIEQVDPYIPLPGDFGEFLVYLGTGAVSIAKGENWNYRYSGYCQKTSIEIEVPEDGYLTVSCDVTADNAAFIYNLVSIGVDFAFKTAEVIDVLGTDTDKLAKDTTKTLAKKVSEYFNEDSEWTKGAIKKLAKKLSKQFNMAYLEEISVLSLEMLDEMYKNVGEDFSDAVLEVIIDLTKEEIKEFGVMAAAKKLVKDKVIGTAEKTLLKAASIMFDGGSYVNLVNSILGAYRYNVGTGKTMIVFKPKGEDGFICKDTIKVKSDIITDEVLLHTYIIKDTQKEDAFVRKTIYSDFNRGDGLRKEELSIDLNRIVEIHEISLWKNGQEVFDTFTATVEMNLPSYIDKRTCSIYRVEKDGTYTKLDTRIEGNKIIFETNHFSEYILTGVIENLQETTHCDVHVYDEARTEPSCTEEGSITYTCYCGDTYTETITANGHSVSEWIVDKDSTCSAEGSKHIECTACEEVLKTEAIAKLSHNYSSVVTEATCEKGGYTTYTCDCGDTYTGDKTPAKGHDYAEGVCKDCGDSKVDNCTCNCHKSGLMGIIWKILRFFYKLFKINPVCGCGVSHY